MPEPKSSTMTMKAPEKINVEVMKVDQKRRANKRYLLQVDRQTKGSFDSMEDAEKLGRSIKKGHPNVQVSIYDSERSMSTVL